MTPARRRPPGEGELCHALTCRRAVMAALVVVTFGALGTRWPDALWPGSWHQSYPMCAQCWQTTRQVAQHARPALVICDATSPPATAASPGPGQ